MTTAQRAASARRLRRGQAPAGHAVPRDPCPSCGVELSRAAGSSGRLALYSTARGSFHWQCPTCRGTWTERASEQSGSTTRSPVSAGT